MKKILFILIIGLTVFSVDQINAQTASSALLPMYLQNNTSNGVCMDDWYIKDFNGNRITPWHSAGGPFCIGGNTITRYLGTYQLIVGEFYMLSFGCNNPYDSDTKYYTRAFIHKPNQQIDLIFERSGNVTIEFKNSELH